MNSNKKEKMAGFRFFKGVLGALFKFYYNPKVIGGENIPKDGAIVVVGNHIHIMDQCLPIMGTKRAIHYMAKREYFDDWKVAWFFKLAGCISVDRSVHDDEAKGKAMEVLDNGWALGLFPEGTRNGLKEAKIEELYKLTDGIDYQEFIKNMKKQKASHIYYLEELVEKKKIKKKDFVNNMMRANLYLEELVQDKVITKKELDEHILLPLKFGAVSMANKKDAYLVPFGISGEYKFRSKNLVCVIGKPFKVENDDLEKANIRVSKEIRQLMAEGRKISGK